VGGGEARAVKIVLATRNEGKLREFRALLASFEFAVVPDLPPVEETGATFAENALLKARAAAAHTRQWALGEDSGLVVDALGGEPGVRSARWSGSGDEANNRRLLEALGDVPEERRTARYVCRIALVDPSGELRAKTEGACEGLIARAPRGEGGFGYDPLFFLPEHGLTMAELPAETKNAISHRARAVQALRSVLLRLQG
jgi:XTP/dITP diphosphohydrolase